MTDAKVRSALGDCERLLAQAGRVEQRHSEEDLDPERFTASVWSMRCGEQARYCAAEAGRWYAYGGGRFVDPATGKDRREKAMRWLGFCQGVVMALGLASLADLKRQSMPDGEEYRP